MRACLEENDVIVSVGSGTRVAGLLTYHCNGLVNFIEES